MERYDSDKAARVWQRVRGEASAPAEIPGLPALIAGEAELQALYRSMARQFPAAAELARDCGRHAAMLRGICDCVGLPRIDGGPGQIDGGPHRNTLRLCYGKTLQAMVNYEKLADHPEYGCAMAAMAQKKREHACKLLERMGTAPTRPGSP